MTFYAAQEGSTPEEFDTEAEAERRAAEMTRTNGKPGDGVGGLT